MAFKHLLIICLQTYLFQLAFSQCAGGYGPSQLGIPGPGQILPIGGIGNINPNPIGPGPLGPGPLGPGYGNGYGAYGSNYPAAYGGSGSGDVAVAGELPVVGTTVVAGQVPVIGGVQFGGSLPAAGVVTISGTCSCGSGYGY